MAGDERSHQVEAGAMQGYNCFLYFHFPPLSETKSVSQMTASECERECVCACVASPATFLIDSEQGSHRNCHPWGSEVTQKQRVSTGTALFLLPCSVLLPLYYSEKEKKRLSGNKVTT